METTRNKLTPYEDSFFKSLRNYIDKPIYFYGSIQRGDYFSQMSDIDIDIFTDNELSTTLMINNHLNLNSDTFKKCLYRLDTVENKIVYGYKGKYIDELNNLKVEISVYNEKFKHDILKEHGDKTTLPFYITIYLIIIKFLYYKLGILPEEYYKICKNTVINAYHTNNTPEFAVVEP